MYSFIIVVALRVPGRVNRFFFWQNYNAISCALCTGRPSLGELFPRARTKPQGQKETFKEHCLADTVNEFLESIIRKQCFLVH